MTAHVLFYISGHGFGHAARDVEVINALRRLRPGLHVTLRTDVPEWFLRESLSAVVTRLPGEVDTGMVQPDGITLDEDATALDAARFHATFDARVAHEVEIIRTTGATLVVGDIPALASAAADAAGLPSVALGNFTWDWIYHAYSQFESLAPGVVEQIADAYARTTLALRLPFSGGFAAMPRVEDVPLVARHARVSREDARARLSLDQAQLVVLASFGGHGGRISLDKAASDAFTLVTVGDDVPPGEAEASGVRVVSSAQLRAAHLSYTDLLAASDVVVSKLGYGIVADCLANGVPLLYTLRGRFVEQDVFVREMPHVLRCRYIDPTQLRHGDWFDGVAGLLAQPQPAQTLDTNGADVVAARVLAMLED